MAPHKRSVLLLGESNVGKTHYGAQVLKRLIVGRSSLKMDGQATNLGPFEQAMESLAEGCATGHTPSETYVESIWPVVDQKGNQAQLFWPDYGGEQIKNLIAEHRIAAAWRERVLIATDWILLVRLHTLKGDADIFSRPLFELGKSTTGDGVHRPSDQARLIELLQMLLHICPASRSSLVEWPTLTVLLSCWDEVEAVGTPPEALRVHLPMFSDFIESVWEKPEVMGLSALERPLSENQGDQEYAIRGPESFGYIVRSEGEMDSDITWPLTRLVMAS